jgi:Flp pilus assembly protein TadD
MAYLMRAARSAATLRVTKVMAGLTATLLLSACADTVGLLPKAETAVAHNSEDADPKSAVPQTELQKATTYWGQEYAKKPAELKPALNYARNLKALGEKTKAMAVLQQTAAIHDSNPELAGEYGRLALDLDQVGVAARMLQIADDPTKPDWRVISARGTVLAKQGQYKDAIPFYERALTLAQNQPSVLNNLAMAYAMSGDAKKAEELLRQAAAARNDQNSAKVKQNLALVLGLEGRYDEAKSVTAGTASAEASAENIDMLRHIVKADPKTAPNAVAAAPDFKTQVSRAIATADPAPVAGSGDAYKPPAQASAVPVFKAAATDAPAAAATTVWQANVATSSPPAALKGSAP